jgi:hypothetical protein
VIPKDVIVRIREKVAVRLHEWRRTVAYRADPRVGISEGARIKERGLEVHYIAGGARHRLRDAHRDGQHPIRLPDRR